MADVAPSDAAMRCVDVLFQLPIGVDDSHREMTSYGKKSRTGLAAIVDEHFMRRHKELETVSVLELALHQLRLCKARATRRRDASEIGVAISSVASLLATLNEGRL